MNEDFSDMKAIDRGMSLWSMQWRKASFCIFIDEGGAEKRCEPELNARDLLSFAWQIASGMVWKMVWKLDVILF